MAVSLDFFVAMNIVSLITAFLGSKCLTKYGVLSNFLKNFSRPFLTAYGSLQRNLLVDEEPIMNDGHQVPRVFYIHLGACALTSSIIFILWAFIPTEDFTNQMTPTLFLAYQVLIRLLEMVYIKKAITGVGFVFKTMYPCVGERLRYLRFTAITIFLVMVMIFIGVMCAYPERQLPSFVLHVKYLYPIGLALFVPWEKLYTQEYMNGSGREEGTA